MSFLKRKLGRKMDGDCLGIGRDPMLIRLRRRQEVMQLGTGVFLSRNHRKRQIRMGILSNVDEHYDICKTVMRDSPDRIVQLQLLVPDLVDKHLALVFVKQSTLKRIDYRVGEDRPA